MISAATEARDGSRRESWRQGSSLLLLLALFLLLAGSPALAQIDSDGDGLDDSMETSVGTDPNDPDSDDDDVIDGDEVSWNQDTDNDGLVNALDPDSDADGLDDGEEMSLGTSMVLTDSDADGLGDYEEVAITHTDPALYDTDAEGLSDYEEVFFGIDGLITDPWNPDSDGDGLTDFQERPFAQGGYGSNALVYDTDSDGLSDYEEIYSGQDGYTTDPLVSDSDVDGLSDGAEADLGTHPLNADTDGDGIDDAQEQADGTNPNSADSDSDGLADLVEITAGTLPLLPDSDSDGILDGAEELWNTDTDGDGAINALDPDSDGDGLADGDELPLGGSPILEDTDDDGMTDGQEAAWNSFLDDDDTDDDGVTDGAELLLGTSPLLKDSDNDGLADGLEIGLDAAQGDDTNPLIFTPDTDPASTTNPLLADSDGDGLPDGLEDADANGARDGDDPTDPVSDWQSGGETDPNLIDTDGDGMTDGLEISTGDDPLLPFTAQDLDWTADSLLTEAVVGAMATDSLYIVNTDPSNNPDETDGPSIGDIEAVSLDVTDLYSDTGRRLPAEWLRLEPRQIFLLPNGADSLVTLTMALPNNASSGTYSGTVTATSGGGVPFAQMTLVVAVSGGGDLEVLPNPVYSDRQSRAEFSYRATAGMTLTIDIYTMALEKVNSLTTGTVYTDEEMYSLYWDLDNEAGRRVASGTYLAVARFVRPEGNSLVRRKIMVIH